MVEAGRFPLCTPLRVAASITDGMIKGVVTRDRQAIISLKVQGPAGQERDIEAIIDTGFDGQLSLPESLVAALALAWRRRGCALLADGSDTIFDIYKAAAVWDGQSRRISVDEAETAPLVGMGLLEGY